MTQTSDESQLAALRKEAEAALRSSDGPAKDRAELAPLLERIIELAPEGSEASVFAHRHLAELHLEDGPWRAALHLRKVMSAGHDDDVIHALMGLCHALLGNFRASVAAYRRALALSPRNPWYHHNLGHLLDVALSAPRLALAHLRTAHRLEPLEDEITASVAHCLAGLGHIEEAKGLASDAVRASPQNLDHRALLEWIERGAPPSSGPHAASSSGTTGGAPSVGGGARGSSSSRRIGRGNAALHGGASLSGVGSEGGALSPNGHGIDEDAIQVLEVLERQMRDAGFSDGQIERARSLWVDYRHRREVRVQKPALYAAALEYAMVLVERVHGVTQASIASRYGVSAASVSSRFADIRAALSLTPGDPRYVLR